jgi:hypothetical protein
MKAGELIGMFIVVLLGSSLLPNALDTWYGATEGGAKADPVNGTLAFAPEAFKTMWELVPLGVALTIFAGIVMVAVSKFND